MTQNSSPCRCGSGETYQLCCQPFHQGQALPKTAEQLMRSRYCAFCLNIHHYLAETILPDKSKPTEIQSDSATQWISLSIVDKKKGTTNDQNGSVEFIATFEENGQFFELHEKSTFVKQNTRWYYVDGEPEVNNINLKWKRNESCWCHSGLKYKKCHG